MTNEVIYSTSIQGSSSTPYLVEMTFHEQEMAILCSCPAGEKNVLCKHRVSTVKNILGGIEGDDNIATKLINAGYHEVFFHLDFLEKEAVRIKNEIKSYKKIISEKMR